MRRHRFGSPRSRLMLAAVLAVARSESAPAAGPRAPRGRGIATSRRTGRCRCRHPGRVPRGGTRPGGTESTVAAGWRRCVNPPRTTPSATLRLVHRQIPPQEVCAQLHPTRFSIPGDSEYPLTALNVKRVRRAEPDRRRIRAHAAVAAHHGGRAERPPIRDLGRRRHGSGRHPKVRVRPAARAQPDLGPHRRRAGRNPLRSMEDRCQQGGSYAHRRTALSRAPRMCPDPARYRLLRGRPRRYRE